MSQILSDLQTPLKAELLSPAGSLKAMRYAFAYGADAVYAGQPRYSLRVRNNEFTHKVLAGAIQEAHDQGKRLFVASNILAHDKKVKTYLKDLEPVIEAGPDALIMSDPGLIMMVRQTWPELEIHLSVQANVVNSAAVKFWHHMGLKRVILSRELSLDEVAEICKECPEMDIETFIHGSLCMAYSGRCLLSGYFNHRDPNQGSCTNACRWKYKISDAKQDDFGTINPDQTNPVKHSEPTQAGVEPQLGLGEPVAREYLIEDVTRPGKMMPIREDESGTQILNSKDLRAIQHVEKLIQIGVKCLKIEGRTKSFFYAARTAQLYRKAIDDALAGKPFDMNLMDSLEGLSTRGYTEGFYRRHVHDEYQSYEEATPDKATQKFVGEITHYNPNTNLATVEVKNHFEVGDELEVMLPSGNKKFKLDHIENKDGNSISVAPGSGHVVQIPLETKDSQVELGLVIQYS